MTVKTPEELAADKAAKEASDLKAVRESIKVTSGRATVDEEDKTDEEKEAEAKAAEDATKAAAKVENVEAKIEESEKTEEELEAEKLEAKTAADKAKIQRRIDREVGKRKELENKIKELEAKLAANPDKENALTEEEVEKRAETKAQQKQMQREFDQASNRLFDAAVKIDKDFQKKVTAMAEDIGGIPGHMIGILDDLDNGGDVLVYFTANPDEAQEMYELSPAKAAVKLAKLSATLEAEKKPKPKEISKVPDPVSAIKGGDKNPDTLPKDPTQNMAEFVRVRNKQAEQHRRAKLGLH